MIEGQPSIAPRPLFSIIIAVYNDWKPLDRCLRSLSEQKLVSNLEAIIADDGSDASAPEFILNWRNYFPLTITRQLHAGISVARNRAAQISRGAILLFVDADCRLRPDCLENLASAIAGAPSHDYFQLHLVGDCQNVVGRAEELRLIMVQEQTLQLDGRIRYLNTAGFAIRRSALDPEIGVFDPAALRAEDTFFMANLMCQGKLPLFVPNATVQHAIPLSLVECFYKDFRSVWLEAKTYELIASKGVRFRLSYRERLSMLRSMWKTSGSRGLRRVPWFVVTARQGLRLLVSYIYHFSRLLTRGSAKS